MKIVPLSGRFESGDESQRGGLATAALADDDHEFSSIDVEVGLIHGGDGAKLLGQFS